MRQTWARSDVGAVAAAVVALILASLPGAGHAGGIQLPNLNLKPKDLDPFNPNSKLREGLSEADRQRLKIIKDPARFGEDRFNTGRKYVGQRFHVVESWTSEQLLDAYRDHVVSKNKAIKGYRLKEAELHYRMIFPVLGKELDLKSVTFYFDAYIPSDMAGITFENRVYIAEKHQPDSPYQAVLLAHELTHVVQYARLGGWKGFARRYAGQIGKSLRSGKATDTVAWHDSLDIEKEADATEVRLGAVNPAGMSITNRTRGEAHYAIRPNPNSKWKAVTLKPGETAVHSYPLVSSGGTCLDPEVQFDHSYADGFQLKCYNEFDLAYRHNRREPLTASEAEAYHFAETDNHKGIDLYTGQGQAPKPVQTIQVSFHNDTRQTVAFHLNGGRGLDASLAAGKTNTYKVVVDPEVVPAVSITQGKGKPLSFSLADGAEYEFRADGGRVKNFYKGRGKAPLFSGTWAGAWSNSVGEKGKEVLKIVETEAGVITGTLSDVPVRGHRADADTIELKGGTATRAYRITGTVVKDVMNLTYTATRLDKGGSYDGKARLARPVGVSR